MLIRRLHSKIRSFIESIYRGCKYSYLYMQEKKKFGNFYFPYRKLHEGEEVYILANGPSLKGEILQLMESRKDLSQSVVVNFFIESELFHRIRPKYYCLADPIFNQKSKLTERTKGVYAKLNNEVTWSMTLFVWKEAEGMLRNVINNPNIQIVGLSILMFGGFESNRYKYYKKGMAVPSYVNVTIMALYAMLNLGYSTIYLYGVDHTFLTNLVVGDDNILYVEDCHFYGTERVIADYHADGTPWRVAEYIYDKYLTFVEHEVMRGYANYLGAQIINCTKGSWIDAYVRRAQLEKQSE